MAVKQHGLFRAHPRRVGWKGVLLLRTARAGSEYLRLPERPLTWHLRSMRERRRHNRSDISALVRVAHSEQTFSVASLNLSASGALLDTEIKLPIGTRLYVRLTSPWANPRSIQAEAEVVRTSSRGATGLAIRFTSVAEEDRALLQEMIGK